MKRVMISGATGMIGGHILEYCLASDAVSEVVSLTRKSTGNTHPKLKEIIHSDFSSFAKAEGHFQKIDVAIFCLGVYTGAVPEDAFRRITVDYTKSFADTLKSQSPDAVFCFLSGAGADRSEKSKIAFARYKGMAENYLVSKEFKRLHIFRPAYIYPAKPRKEPNLSYRIMRWMYPLIRLMGQKYSVQSTVLANAIFKAGVFGTDKMILENRDIVELAKK